MRRSKYGAIRTEVDGIKFASKREAKRYGELKLLERAGKIHNLTVQPRFDLVVHGTNICTYVGDFRYLEDGWIVEDVKGVRTSVYRIKAKLMLACHGIKIKET